MLSGHKTEKVASRTFIVYIFVNFCYLPTNSSTAEVFDLHPSTRWKSLFQIETENVATDEFIGTCLHLNLGNFDVSGVRVPSCL